MMDRMSIGKVLVAAVAIASVAMLLASCGTLQFPDSFKVDLRSADMPILLNDGSDAAAGRVVSAEAFTSSSVSTSTSSYGNYSVTTTTTNERWSTMPLSSQVLAQIGQRDVFMRINNLWFFAHYLGMPYYSERDNRAGIDARAQTGGVK